jgi:hypothetical protein
MKDDGMYDVARVSGVMDIRFFSGCDLKMKKLKTLKKTVYRGACITLSSAARASAVCARRSRVCSFLCGERKAI